MMLFTYLFSFVASLLLSILVTRSVRNTALSHGWRCTKPPSNRDIHIDPIPRLGGVAIFLIFTIVVSLAVVVSAVGKLPFYFSPVQIVSILFTTTLVFVLGLYDDLYSAGPYVKVGVEIIAAVIVFLAGFRVFFLPLFFGTRTLSWMLSMLATVFWVLLVTNAFNLVDGIDGLAAGSALFSTMTMFAVSLATGRHTVSLLALVLAGAILGFLRYNFNPATIFLGDCGSLFIGFVLSILALAGSQKSSTIVAVGIPVVSFGLPILETSISVVRRFLSGQPLFAADRDHIHHKLMERGLSQRQVLVILYGVSAIFGLISAFLLYPGGPIIGLVLFVLGIGIWIGVQHLNYPEFFELGRVARRTVEQKGVIINNLAIRRATSRLSKAKEVSELYEALREAFRNTNFDGFDLWSTRPVSESSSLSNGMNGEASLHYSWKKNNRDGNWAQPSPFVWTLSLELADGDTQMQGCFRLYQESNRGTVQMDINLLINEFRIVLANALDRIMQDLEAKNNEFGPEVQLQAPTAFVNSELTKVS